MVAPQLFVLLQEASPPWLEILAASSSIEDSQYVDPDTNLTPLHLAVMAKTDSMRNDFRIGVIRSLLQSNLTATEVCCHEHGFTPLMYACLVLEGESFLLESLELNVPVVKLLMEYNPRAFQLRSPRGYSALDLHILTMSRWWQQDTSRSSTSTTITMHHDLLRRTKSATVNGNKKSGTRCVCVLLNALVENDLGIALMKSLDLLLACNTLEVMEYVAQEEAQAFMRRLKDRRQQRRHPNVALPIPAGSSRTTFSTLQGFWVWEFLLAILRAEHQHTFVDVKPVPPFNALHMASQIDDFPLPFLILCIRMYPSQVRTSSVVKSDLPLHSIASWQVRCESQIARKSMALTQLLAEHPTASQRRNDDGKTPLSLAIETGTAWNSGIRRLTAAQKEEDSIILRASFSNGD